jgi:N-acetyl sugar amidotransferase
MQFCTRCVYASAHPLGLTFDAGGVCSGCRIHEEKTSLDWSARRNKLEEIFCAHRNRSGANYDCIIPVSGARDSYFIVHTVKEKFGMNPLLVTYNKHYNTKMGIRNLAYLRTIFDCDLFTMTLAPQRVQQITRATLRTMGSMYWHALAGQTVWPVQVAVRLKIPLIVWGEHQGIDQVGMFSHKDAVEMTRKYRKEHDLMGWEAEDLVGIEGLTIEDVKPFMYPHDLELSRVGVRGIYLGNFIPWDTKRQHEEMIAKYGYETRELTRTFDSYNDVDCFHYSDIHDWIKFVKCGYGRVTDHAARELRWGRLSREDAINLIETHEQRRPESRQLFFDWVGMTEAEFTNCIEQFRDLKLWEQSDGGWRMRDHVREHASGPRVAAARLPVTGSCKFLVSASRAPEEQDDAQVLIGRGWADRFPAAPYVRNLPSTSASD